MNTDDHILFLNGLPPILKLNSEVSVAFQNANIFRSFYSIRFFKWLFSKDSLRNIIFKLGRENVNNWFVFSPVAANILNKKIGKHSNLKIIDIYSDYKNEIYRSYQEFEYDFIYPASGLSHKNHKLLFEILISLSKEKIFPRVLFTLEDKYIKKFQLEKIKKIYNLRVENYLEKDQEKFFEIYKKCKSLLYLSTNETIGLPLLEANKCGLITVAPNLDYSTQFIKPDYIFDMNSKSELQNIIRNILSGQLKKKEKVDSFLNMTGSISFENFFKKII